MRAAVASPSAERHPRPRVRAAAASSSAEPHHGTELGWILARSIIPCAPRTRIRARSRGIRARRRGEETSRTTLLQSMLQPRPSDSEHGPWPSSHETTRPPSPSQTEVFSEKKNKKAKVETGQEDALYGELARWDSEGKMWGEKDWTRWRC